ncbi:MAG: tetratricopeptide repeat protein [Coriobacteriales bacterium]
MDISTFNRAKAAYDAQEWETAAILFSACQEGPGSGEASHLRGNALMRLGRVPEAVEAYRRAAQDSSYPHRGAVFTNLGKAQVALGDYKGAIESLRSAIEDPNYPGAYKAWLALGGAYSRLGDARNAGIAYRKAALEANNPDPAKALINLGVCFVQMRRPEDAASAYRTALDFSQDANERDMILSNLGQAYVASNRMLEAVQAFTEAVNDGYQLLPPAQADFDRARQAANSLAGTMQGAGGSQGASSASLAGLGGPESGIDPLDPLGRSGEVMPSPDESGFFDITEEQIEAAGKKAKQKSSAPKGKGRRHGVSPLVVILIVVIVAIVGCIVAYLVFGAGIPSQSSAINSVFSAAESGSSSSDGWSSGISSDKRAEMLAEVTSGSTHEIRGVDYSMSDSSTASAYVLVTLPEGGTISYDVTLARSGLGWSVTSVESANSSLTTSSFSAAASGSVATASSASDATATSAAVATSAAAEATATPAQAVDATTTAAAAA